MVARRIPVPKVRSSILLLLSFIHLYFTKTNCNLNNKKVKEADYTPNWQRRWFSGKIFDSHSKAPGSIPGRRKFNFVWYQRF
jgi:hypothetical protein